jgi:hypothetical protein
MKKPSGAWARMLRCSFGGKPISNGSSPGKYAEITASAQSGDRPTRLRIFL